MNKNERQAKILEIVAENKIGNQRDLVEFLNKAGIITTQSTVSRDIKELRLTRVATDTGEMVFQASQQPGETQEEIISPEYLDRLEIIFKETVTEIVSNKFLIIIKTLPGMASAAAHAIDTLNLEEILGTIAGDDTIFIALRDGTDIDYLLERFHELKTRE